MGNCLPRLLSFGRGNMEGTPMRRSPSTSSTSSQDGPMSFSNPMMLSQNSPYVSQLYAANVRRQRQANQQEKDLEAAKQKRIQGLLEQISADIFTEDMKAAECAICMIDFEPGDCIRFLPCMHSFHKDCVDEWLHKSFTCPSCLEPVDSTILSSLTAHTQQTFQDLMQSSQEASVSASSAQTANK